MKVFITGATGFVGRALATFLTDGMTYIHDVTGLMHDFRTEWVHNDKLPHGIYVDGDVRDYKRMREILLKFNPDAIIHFAAQPIVQQAQVDPYLTFDVNVNGTISLLQAWRDYGTKGLGEETRPHFIYFSTDKVYGDGLDKKETDPVQASADPYAASKAAADLIAQRYLPDITITRSCNIYGPGDTHPTRLIPHLIKSCMENRQPKLRMPDAVREYIYIDDVCRVLAWLLENRKTGIWNIGSGKMATPRQILRDILVHFPNMASEFSQVKQFGPEFMNQSLDVTKLCGELDCLSFTIPQIGIKRTVEWWRTQHPS